MPFYAILKQSYNAYINYGVLKLLKINKKGKQKTIFQYCSHCPHTLTLVNHIKSFKYTSYI